MKAHINRIVSIFIIVILMLTICIFILSCDNREKTTDKPDVFHAQGEMAGEVTRTSVILQSRLTASDSLIAGDLPGSTGTGCFEISTVEDFQHFLKTPWIDAVPENDFIIKTKVSSLKPGTRYYYRLVYGRDKNRILYGAVSTFKTLPDTTAAEEVSFVVVTGMNYHFFHSGRSNKPETAYHGMDKQLGYPALESILTMEPDFFIGTGDNVYYDVPEESRARTLIELRKKWHEQFIQERYKKLFARIPAYWEKDDHDYRYNDCDTTGTKEPSHQLGIKTFLEQVPVVDPQEENPKTYRTYRVNNLLQIWFTEGRDYRSSNNLPDGPGKSLWGNQQKEWLKKTLLASNAVFKIIVSPTPMVGPDDAYKSDNHVNQKGFRYEGEKFFQWLKKNDFLRKNFYLVCGDRHWQYHSIHPSGFEEFSCGALVDANSRLGRKPGDPESTDPDAIVKQLYTQDEPSGGFLKVTVKPGNTDKMATAEFNFYDENGVLFYSEIKYAQ